MLYELVVNEAANHKIIHVSVIAKILIFWLVEEKI